MTTELNLHRVAAGRERAALRRSLFLLRGARTAAIGVDLVEHFAELDGVDRGGELPFSGFVAAGRVVFA